MIFMQMRAAAVLLLAPILLGGAPLTPPAAHDKKLLEEANARWLTSFRTKDGAALAEVLDEDFIGVYGTRALSKADLIASATSAQRQVSDIRWEGLQVHVAGDTAVVTGESVLTAVQDGTSVTTRSAYADVYVRKHGKWKAIAASVRRID